MAFSKKRLFRLKERIDALGKHKCAIVYGGLPQEVRRDQASLFNEPDNDYSILVATDAVGMGLNLNIGRIVFETLSKFDGESLRALNASEIKQIGGRAGRFKSEFVGSGGVTCFKGRGNDLDLIRRALDTTLKPLPFAQLNVFYEQCEVHAATFQETRGGGAELLHLVLSDLRRNAELDKMYRFANIDRMLEISLALAKAQVAVSFDDAFKFCYAPTKSRENSVRVILQFAKALGEYGEVKLSDSLWARLPRRAEDIKTVQDMEDLEGKYDVFQTYLWLSHYYPEEVFPSKERVVDVIEDISAIIEWRLMQGPLRADRDQRGGRNNARHDGRRHATEQHGRTKADMRESQQRKRRRRR